MALNTAVANMTTARQLVTAVEAAGGTTPKVLFDLIAGSDLLAAHPAPPRDPVKPIVEAAAESALTPQKLAQLLAQAAQEATAADYRGQLRGRCEGQFDERFHCALCDGCCCVGWGSDPGHAHQHAALSTSSPAAGH